MLTTKHDAQSSTPGTTWRTSPNALNIKINHPSSQGLGMLLLPHAVFLFEILGPDVFLMSDSEIFSYAYLDYWGWDLSLNVNSSSVSCVL